MLRVSPRANALQTQLNETVLMTIWSEYFSSVPDPRRQSGLTKHLLSDILGIALCAMLCGADDFMEFALYGRERQEFLRGVLGFSLPNGIPSHDTFTRVFARLNPQSLEKCLWGWLSHWQDHAPNHAPNHAADHALKHLSVDGKTARGTWEGQTNVCALTTVSVFASELRLVLATKRLAGQGGENTLVASLLELLDLQDALVSGDAAYCQKAVAQTIHEKKGDYLFTLKANHRTLYTQVKAVFEASSEASSEASCERSHGRLEKREVWSHAVAQLPHGALLQEQWPGLQSVVKIRRTRRVMCPQKAVCNSQNEWFYLSSLRADDARLAGAMREHWKIENQAHWVLDVVLGEDKCRTRREHAPHNLALLRRIALNLLRQNQGGNSLKATRKAVTWNPELLAQILHTPLALL